MLQDDFDKKLISLISDYMDDFDGKDYEDKLAVVLATLNKMISINLVAFILQNKESENKLKEGIKIAQREVEEISLALFKETQDKGGFGGRL